jgi:hypothetical protein
VFKNTDFFNFFKKKLLIDPFVQLNYIIVTWISEFHLKIARYESELEPDEYTNLFYCYD